MNIKHLPEQIEYLENIVENDPYYKEVAPGKFTINGYEIKKL